MPDSFASVVSEEFIRIGSHRLSVESLICYFAEPDSKVVDGWCITVIHSLSDNDFKSVMFSFDSREEAQEAVEELDETLRRYDPTTTRF